jgi:hypothetical protein
MANYKIGDEVLVRAEIIGFDWSVVKLTNGLSIFRVIDIDIESLAPPKPNPIKVGDWCHQTVYPYQKLLQVVAITDGQAWLRDMKGIYQTVAIKQLMKAPREKRNHYSGCHSEI